LICFNDNANAQRLTIKSISANALPYRLDLSSGEEQAWPWYQREQDQLIVYIDAVADELIAMIFKKEKQKDVHLVGSTIKVIGATGTFGSMNLELEDVSNGGVITLANRTAPQLGSDPSLPISIRAIGQGLWQAQLTAIANSPAVQILDWKLTLPGMFSNQPVDIQCGWESQGGADYAGRGIYHAYFDLKELPLTGEARLRLPRVETTAALHLNGYDFEVRGWPPYAWRIPLSWLRAGTNEVEIEVWSTAANHYYAGTPYQPLGKLPCGLIGVPIVELIHPLIIHCSQE
jgi:hypothetical protein